MPLLKQYSRRFFFFLAIMGPGLITATADNDSGGIATYAVAGAHFGYSLLWTLIPMVLLLIYTLDVSTRLGVVSRLGLASLIREKFRVKLMLPLLFLLLIANIGTTVSEFAGIASSLKIFSEPLNFEPSGLPWGNILQIAAVVFSAIIIWVVVVKGNYKRVERVFLSLIVFYLVYIISAILAKPDWGAAFEGLLIPTMKLDIPFLFTMIGMIGTTITPWMYFYHVGTVTEKGLSESDLRYSRLDSFLGSVTTAVVAFFIIVASAATIFVNHLPVQAVEDIGHSLGPLAGEYAVYLFAFGLLNASIFAAAIVPLSTAYAIGEAIGWETGIDKGFREAPQFYSIFTGMILLGVIFVLIPGLPLLFIMRLSQVANGIVLPFFLIYLLLLAEDERLMGKYRTKGVFRWFGWSIACALMVLNIIFLAGPFFS